MSSKEFETATFKDLQRAYSDAVAAGKDTFFIGSVEFYVGYAKYLIEYLGSVGVTGDRLLVDLLTHRQED